MLYQLFEFIYYYFDLILGVGKDQQMLTTWHIGLRTVFVYAIAVLLVRIGRKRFLAKPSSFDLVLLLMLGSVLSRAITGNAPFFSTIGAAFVLILLHTLLSYLTFNSTKWGAIIKGRAMILIKSGNINWDNMRRAQLTERDLLSALRQNAQVLDPREVKLAILERNGEISIIKKPKNIGVFDMDVEQGVKKVHVVLDDQ